MEVKPATIWLQADITGISWIILTTLPTINKHNSLRLILKYAQQSYLVCVRHEQGNKGTTISQHGVTDGLKTRTRDARWRRHVMIHQ